MFKIIGIAVAVYTLVSAARGEVYARSGIWGRTIERDATPIYFWTVIAIYAGLSIALLTVF